MMEGGQAVGDCENTGETESKGIVRIVMDDAAEVIGKVAERFYDEPSKSLTLIGITGTNGKTTTAHLIHDMLNSAGEKCGLIGAISVDTGGGMKPAELTTPFAVDLSRSLAKMVENGCTHAVMEVSSHALAQGRVSGLSFTGAIFTNLSGDHLDYHGSMEKYADAKSLLFQPLNKPDSWAVINMDDAHGMKMAEACAGHVKIIPVRQSDQTKPADWSVSIENINSYGMELILQHDTNRHSLHTILVGEHNAMNLSQACAAVNACGISITTTTQLAASCHAPPGRLEPVSTRDDPSGIMVLVDYAHTDDALANALKAVRPLADARGGRLLVIFGCGGDRDKSKRPRMMKIACDLAEVIMVTSDNPRTENPETIVRDILAGIPAQEQEHKEKAGELFTQTGRRQAIEQVIVDIAHENDVVLIAGKGHEDYQIIGRTKHALDDRIIARYSLLRRISRLQMSNTPDENNISNIFWSSTGFATATGGQLVSISKGNNKNTSPRSVNQIPTISTDSRTIQSGEAFIAIAGNNFDGHDYVETAITRGAPLLIINRSWWEYNKSSLTCKYHENPSIIDESPVFLIVKDTTAALGDLASCWRESLFNTKTKVIAITGSCGKTTTKEILKSVLTVNFHGTTGIKSYNNEIGVPITILTARPEDDFLIVEIGSNSPGEIHALGSIARPDIAIITNVGRSHLWGFGSVEGVAREKISLFSTLASQNSRAVYPSDNSKLKPLIPAGICVTTFGQSTSADLRLVNEQISNTNTTCETHFTLHDQSCWSLPVIGKHFVLDTLAVIATARAMGMNDSDIQIGLSNMKLPTMRMEKITLPGNIHIYNDAYNANPESMLASLYTFLKITRRTAPNHRILILGEMLELGSATLPCHRELMLKVARLAQRQLIDKAIFIGRAFREASPSGIRFGSWKPNGPTLDWVESIEDETELARITSSLTPGDTVLLKGSRGVGLERVIVYAQNNVEKT